MASSQFTANLGLCSWLASDRPKRADFVSDNGIIDRVLGNHVNDTDAHMSQQEKEKALQPYTSVIYAGSGTASRSIEIGYRPGFAIVYKKNAPPIEYRSGVTIVNCAVCCYGHGSTSGAGVNSSGVTVVQQSAAQDGVRVSLNEEDCQYAVIAFK